MNHNEIGEDLQRFKAAMLIHRPFFGDILLRLPIVQDDGIATACTDAGVDFGRCEGSVIAAPRAGETSGLVLIEYGNAPAAYALPAAQLFFRDENQLYTGILSGEGTVIYASPSLGAVTEARLDGILEKYEFIGIAERVDGT